MNSPNHSAPSPVACSGPILDRIRSAHHRAAAEGSGARLALVVIPSPEYDVPVFNLCSAELAGFLRFKNPELASGGIEFLEPDILFSRSDLLKSSPRWIVRQLRQSRPHIIGLSAKIGSTENLLATLRLLEQEDWARESVIVVGNVLSTFSSDRLILAYPDVLYAVGDGELTLNQLYQWVRDGESSDLQSLPNVTFITDDGLTHSTRKQLLEHSEQQWLPAFDMLEMAQSKKADIVIRATTGCSAHCTFCSIRELNLFTDAAGATRKAGWRSYPPERTAAQLQFLQSRGIVRVNFADDEFGNVDFEFLDRLADLLILQGNQVRFNVSMRLDAFWTPTMPEHEYGRRSAVLQKLLLAGLDSIFAGAESGSPSQLKRYGKGYPVAVNQRSLELLVSCNVKVHVGFIPFDQFVNRVEVQENLDFLESTVAGHPLHRYVTSPINVMRVQRGTPYEGLMRRAGLLGELEDNLSFYASKFVDPRMERIASLAKDWYSQIQDSRYPLIQLRRYAADNSLFVTSHVERTDDLMDRMHRLDIDLIRALLGAFEEDDYDRMFAGKPAFLQRHPELANAVECWTRAVALREPQLQEVLGRFCVGRDHLERQMQDLLGEIYGRQKSSKSDPTTRLEEAPKIAAAR